MMCIDDFIFIYNFGSSLFKTDRIVCSVVLRYKTIEKTHHHSIHSRTRYRSSSALLAYFMHA